MKIFLDANICLDLLDTKRPTSKNSVNWYMSNKDKESYEFFFSSDFITTFYYVLTQKRKYPQKETILAIDALCSEVVPWYINHNDFSSAKSDFFDNLLTDFEDLIVINSASRVDCDIFITNDKELLKLKTFKDIVITKPMLA